KAGSFDYVCSRVERISSIQGLTPRRSGCTLSMCTEEENVMPRPIVKNNNRVALRIRPADKAVIMRAVAVAQTDMTDFILRAALREARSVIEQHERVKLSRRDSLLVLDLLANPLAPNAKLRKAARALP